VTGALKAVALFSAMPRPARGVVWMTLATLFYACTYGVVRLLSETIPVFEIVFFRSFLGLLVMLPWLIGAGRGALRTRRMGLYWVRTGLNYFGMSCLMYGIANLALQNVTALMFTVPLFTVMFVALLLKEKVAPARWAALAVGFAGALVIIRPGIIELSVATIGVLATSAAYSLINTSTKSLARTEDSNLIVFYVFSLMTLVSVAPAIHVWVAPTASQWPWVVAMGLFSSAAVQCVTRSLAAADAGVVMPFNFLKLPFSVVIGFIWFTERPDLWTGIGAAIIFTSTLYIARREARIKAAAQTR
jgi:drug/metabolite transporter (DMT)-like permease